MISRCSGSDVMAAFRVWPSSQRHMIIQTPLRNLAACIHILIGFDWYISDRPFYFVNGAELKPLALHELIQTSLQLIARRWMNGRQLTSVWSHPCWPFNFDYAGMENPWVTGDRGVALWFQLTTLTSQFGFIPPTVLDGPRLAPSLIARDRSLKMVALYPKVTSKWSDEIRITSCTLPHY